MSKGRRHKNSYYNPVAAQASYDARKAEYERKYGGDRKAQKIFAACVIAGLLIVAVICFIVTGASAKAGTPAADPNTDKVVITREFAVTSKVTGYIAQTYNSTVTGKIKNNTGAAYSDIVITVHAKTKTLEHTGDITVTVGALAAGQEISINQTVATTENFEQVAGVTATAGGAALPLSGAQAAPKTPAEINGAAAAVGGVAAAGLVLAVAILIVRAKRKNDLEQSLRYAAQRLGKVNAAYANFTGSAAPVRGGPFEEEREKREAETAFKHAEARKAEADAQIARANAEARKKEAEAQIERARLEKTRLDAESAKPVYCAYCGAKNAKSDRVCCQCGAKIKE